MFGNDNNNQDQASDDTAVVEPTTHDALGDDNQAQAVSPPPISSAAASYEETPKAPDNNSAVSPAATVPVDTDDDDDLMAIKKQALKQLSPLVDKLDQTPEEKFKTTMMMIQAADDKALVQTAYDAALAIHDEKTRAQALLDVINEINYFTHPQDT